MSHVRGSAWLGLLGVVLVFAAVAAGRNDAQPRWSGGAEGLALAATAADARQLGVGRFVEPTEAVTPAGEAKRWSDGRGEQATVIALTSVTCPLSKRFAPALARIEADYADNGVRFVYVNVSGTDSPDAMHEQIKARGFAGLYLDDRDGHIARTLQAQTTTEVFVIDEANTLLYRGAVNDQYGLRHQLEEPREHYLRQALDAVFAGERPEVRATSAPGCLIDPPEAPEHEQLSTVTYTKNISRIMQNSCIECHRTGGIAPFSLDSYRDVARRANMIEAVIDEGIMPPWFAAPPEDGPSPWHNDRSLTVAETEAIRAWIEAGTPEGDSAHAPVPRDWPEGDWTIGAPDVVLELPEPVEVQAEGTMPYEHVIVPTEFAEDKWVRGYQIVPTAPEVVHHVLVFIAPASALEDRRELRQAISGTGEHLAAYVPGNDSVVYDDGLARKLPADSILIFQMHYTPDGTARRDQTRIGLKFADGEPEHVVRVAGIANTGIEIPAGASDHEERAETPVPHDAKILSFMPHMHVRGKAFRFELEHADGEREMLLDVPRYDFNWQLRYAYREPRRVAAGSTIHVTGWFDNSAANPANPDPTHTVTWGPQTYDEMLLGYVEFYRIDE